MANGDPSSVKRWRVFISYRTEDTQQAVARLTQALQQHFKTLPEALTAFEVQANPADRLPSLAQFLRALDRTLTLPEL
jgi:hypothetical protein